MASNAIRIRRRGPGIEPDCTPESRYTGGMPLKSLSRVCARGLCAGVAVLALASGTLTAQERQAPAPTVWAQLAEGWAAVGSGRFDEAIRIGDALLMAGKEPHRAAALLVSAELARQRPSAALDRYESWLGLQRPDDLYLLTDIAVGYTRALAQGGDPMVQAEARAILERLDGPTPDKAEAAGARADGPLVDGAMARSGDAAATARLRQRLDGPLGPEADYVIGALADAGDKASIPALRRLLKSPQPPVQLAAISALGRLGATDAVEELKALSTQRQPLVATMASVALSRLGDADARKRVEDLLTSPNGEERLMAAESMGVQEYGRWESAITPLLTDTSLMVRVQAALMLSRAGVNVPDAQAVLAQALGSENPILREQAGQAFTSPDKADPTLLRRFLRDRDPRVQLRGVQGLLALSRR
jgi:HEAT repeat protein